MRTIDRVKSWFRQLNPTDGNEVSGETVTSENSALDKSLDERSVGSSHQESKLSNSIEGKQKKEQKQQLIEDQEKQARQQAQQGKDLVPVPAAAPEASSKARNMPDVKDFFTDSGEANRYTIKEVVGKGSYGIVCSAIDNFTGEKVAIKKITNVFEHVSDATRILREIKLLRMLKHPDVVEIKHIMLPPSPGDYKDVYVVFELLETDLHQVIKANDDLTPEHHQFFFYQMLRGLKYIHSAKVFHRDLKPKNILANSDCKLKICDFGLARPAFNDTPTTVFWTDYVATRWYRAPELCGSFFARYSPAIDLWSVGCIFAEVLAGKPLFPGRNVVHQLEIITDLLGTPSQEVINKVKNEKARRFLQAMPKKAPIPFEQHFPRADPRALALLKRLIAFDPSDRPTAEEALADPYFAGLHSPSREPVAQPVSKLAFEFDRRKVSMDDVRDLIYREILEYHPGVLQDYLSGTKPPTFAYPSALESFKRQWAHLDNVKDKAPGADVGVPGQPGSAKGRRIVEAMSLPKERQSEYQQEAARHALAQSGNGNSIKAVYQGLPVDAIPSKGGGTMYNASLVKSSSVVSRSLPSAQ